MEPSDSIILEARNLHKSYPMGRGRQDVLRGVNLAVRRGEFLAIMGASGSGKSTLLHICGVLDRPDKGQVFFEGRDLFALSSAAQDALRSRDIGFVFQFYHLLPELNVEENILLPLMVNSSIWGWLTRRRSARQRARQLIQTVGLLDQARQKPATLSGGERQRAALARALVEDPVLLLADEPTGNLDSRAGMGILEHLKRLNANGQTIVMVTHDKDVARLADRIVHLQDGKIA
ncbi:MAG: ABC transporter ATP-binding protein [Sedimentisphaerales bacterium]|nr:ABC transporter ATP-binding protein [Sedimentisphaerales bacterium]